MDLRNATPADLDRVWELIEQARVFLRQNGTDQWQDGYPDRALIQEDIKTGRTHLLLDDDGSVLATAALAIGADPDYAEIDGRWLTNGTPYAALHRMAVDDAHKGRGLAAELLRRLEDFCRAQHIPSLRVDTDQSNPIMQRLLTKAGYARCGVIQFQGAPRVAFEKLL